jgi:hypothetical protein
MAPNSTLAQSQLYRFRLVWCIFSVMCFPL